jgi:hypothetical protein
VKPRNVKALETEVFCMWMNYTYTLDELVMLRGRVATLLDDAKKHKRR